MYDTTIPKIPLFADLREALLQHDDPKRRWPKWQFVIAPDLAIQVQPQAVAMRFYAVLFKLRVLEGTAITREHFKSNSAAREAGLVQVDYEIRAPLQSEVLPEWRTRFHGDGREWQLVMTRGLARPWRESYADHEARIDAFQRRVQGALRPNEVGEIDVRMLSYRCLICSKQLTDPISMARLIGPECADRHSIPTIRSIQVAAAA
jgi:Family of unknown function (DUF6011)